MVQPRRHRVVHVARSATACAAKLPRTSSNCTCRLKVIAAMKVPLLAVLLVAICCGIYEHVRTHHKPGNAALADLDLTFAYSVVGFALSLLLVFKTNTCYARYWEGLQLSSCSLVASAHTLFGHAQMYTSDLRIATMQTSCHCTHFVGVKCIACCCCRAHDNLQTYRLQ
jgi:predicted membrane chloride channel (bestrophin family)